MRRRSLLAAALAWAGTRVTHAADSLPVAAFSTAKPGAALPPDWAPLGIRNVERRTRYALVEDGGTVVLRADADASASGVSRKLRVDPAEFPLLKWRWKVSHVLKAADLSKKEGDDYPARLYVMFDLPLERLPFGERTTLRMARAFHDPDLPAATICYVWDGKAPAGTIQPSVYTNRVRMIVAESGAARAGRWVDMTRDLAADYRAAFGGEPPLVSAVAVATDTDNTGEAVTAWFGDISLHKRAVSR